MIQHIKHSDYINMPWKNNFGSTLQIDIEKSEKYLWRLSAATIKQENSFSEFNGYNRLLAIWQGQGLLLNDFELLPNQIFEFKGEDQIICKPIHSEVIDLGFIFDRTRIIARMKILNIFRNQQLSFDSEISFLFCVDGEFNINNLVCRSGDTLKLTTQTTIYIGLNSAAARLIQIDVNTKTD